MEKYIYYKYLLSKRDKWFSSKVLNTKSLHLTKSTSEIIHFNEDFYNIKNNEYLYKGTVNQTFKKKCIKRKYKLNREGFKACCYVNN